MTVAFEPNSNWKSAAQSINGFFGRRPGQNIQEFSQELKQLTDEDKAQLHAGIMNGTLTY